jgi:hypothetical protein
VIGVKDLDLPLPKSMYRCSPALIVTDISR